MLGVTESRVSQLHSKAVLRLRSRLKTAGVDGFAINPHVLRFACGHAGLRRRPLGNPEPPL